MKGTTKLVMFRQIFNAVNFAKLLEEALIPFIRSKTTVIN